MDAIELEVMVHALGGITEEMMARLIRAAYSSNIKERRDCSTALFDGRGRSIAQAAAIPVHLGALGDAVAAVLALDPEPGEIYLLNDPFSGGSHLPDLTLITVVGNPTGAGLAGFAVSRAHHSDIGGMRPGSMPADSTTIFEEGLVIPPTRLGRAGTLDLNVLRLILANVRQPAQREADLKAQVAAGALGHDRLRQLVYETGSGRMEAAIDAVLAYTERRVRECIAAIPDGVYEAVDYLEDTHGGDVAIRVAVTVAGEHLHIDFTGTAGAHDSNLNAPIAVTRSAVAFALRALLDPHLPANDGALAPVELHAPPGSLVNARWPVAIVAGNVETSQRIADTLMLALGQVGNSVAQGQGTMNNLILGNGHFNYYETIGGGQGASAAGPGLDGVHVGMSNTLNTPIEALEMEFPLTVRRYELRPGSGGRGLYRGGWGIVRAIEVLEDCTLSLLSDRRRHAPGGVAGGSAGATGRNWLNGEPLPGKATRALRAGDCITVETPGGGGWGAPLE